jgi:hypothetical protein
MVAIGVGQSLQLNVAAVESQVHLVIGPLVIVVTNGKGVPVAKTLSAPKFTVGYCPTATVT